MSKKTARSQALVAATVLCAVAAAVAAPPDREAQPGARTFAVGGALVIGKPVAPIAVDYEILDVPQVAQPMRVRITARPGRGITNVALELTADAQLFVSSVSAPLIEGSSQTSVWTATVTPLEADPGHLNVTVTGELDGEPQARSLLIPIRIGAQTEARAAAPVETIESGERVISLPVLESP